MMTTTTTLERTPKADNEVRDDIRVADTSGENAWKCEFTPHDGFFWGLDHPFIRGLAVAETLRAPGSTALLDVRLELDIRAEQVLEGIRIRFGARDTFGMYQFAWQVDAASVLYAMTEEGTHLLHASIPLERETLHRLERNGPNCLNLVLENAEGRVLDSVTGRLCLASL